MKRLTENRPVPKEEIPEVYKEEPKEEPKEVKFQDVDVEPELSALPKSKLYARLKKLSSFKQIKKDFKLQTQKDQFVADIRALLSHLKKSDHLYDTELLVEVINACNEFFIYGNYEEREQSKAEAVMELMLPFFKEQEILSQFIKTVDAKVKKSNVFRRMFRRMYNFFL